MEMLINISLSIPNGWLIGLVENHLITQPAEGLNEGLKSLLLVIKYHLGIQTKDLSKVLNGRPIKTIDQ